MKPRPSTFVVGIWKIALTMESIVEFGILRTYDESASQSADERTGQR
jgi:hypothetical protein